MTKERPKIYERNPDTGVAWSTTKDYEQQVINIIKKLRQDGKVVIKR